MSGAAVVCVGLAAAAMGLWMPPPPAQLLSRRRVTLEAAGPRGIGHRRHGTLAIGAWAQRRAGLVGSPTSGLGLGLLTTRARDTWRARSAAARRRGQVIELCTAISADLRAGAVPVDALQAAADSLPGLCDEVGRVAVLGGDTVAALRAAAVRPGAEGLRRLAAAWAVTELTGSGLADSCARVAAWLRDEESLRREVSAQLAGARASARLLSVLPLFGLALGSGIGGEPVGFLLGTPYGLACLVAGTALVLTGLWWTERLAHSVETQI